MTSTRARLLAWGGGRRHSDDAVSPPPRPWRGGNLISARPARVELGGSGGGHRGHPSQKNSQPPLSLLLAHSGGRLQPVAFLAVAMVI